MERIDLGFTDAEPTMVFGPQDVVVLLPCTDRPALPRLRPGLLHLTLAAPCIGGENRGMDPVVAVLETVMPGSASQRQVHGERTARARGVNGESTAGARRVYQSMHTAARISRHA